MKLVGRMLTCLLLLAGSHAYCEEEAPVIAVPDPAILSADWWTYFEPKDELTDEAAKERVDNARTFYQNLRLSLEQAGKTGQLVQLDKLLADLDRYAEQKFTPEPVAPPAIVIATRYTMSDALQYFTELETLGQQNLSETEELAWQNTVHSEKRKSQSRLRGKYLAMDSQAPDRLEKGLDLMRKRLALEVQRIELAHRKIRLQHEKTRAQHMREQVSNIAGLLSSTPEERKYWEERYASTRQTADKLRDEIDSNATRGSQNQSDLQLQTLAGIQEDIALNIQEIRAGNARVALRLITLISDKAAFDNKAARKDMDDFQVLHDAAADKTRRWERVIARVTNLLNESGSDEPGTVGNNVQDGIRQQLAATGSLLADLRRDQARGEFLVQMLDTRLRNEEGWLTRNIKELFDNTINMGKSTYGLLGATLFEVNETPVTALGLLRVLLILTISLWLSRIIRRAIKHIGERNEDINQSSLYTVGRLIHYVIITIGIIIGMSTIGIDFTKFALFASALAVGIGFGLQTLISNFVAGLIILFEKSLKVGDFVELESGVTGEVRDINMRSTLVTTNDNIDILVPNSEFVGSRVINWTLRDAYRRAHISFGVAYGTDKDLVRKAVLEAAGNVQWTLTSDAKRQPQVWFVEFGDSSLNFELVVWLTPEAVKRPGAVQAAYLWEIESKLAEYNIEIPFPQRDLHLRSAFGAKDEAMLDLFPATASAGSKDAP